MVVSGVATDFCVRWGIDGLLARGFNVSVPPRLTRGIVRQIKDVAVGDFASLPVNVRS
ncbi:hypothetical protein [Sphingomonas sp. SORGH_AS_0742]|uniref:hypothetical protein n=1 Tax=Sphingomonas sp. SORGH_AS_0742 TaxID=3041797 RepID=UPI00286CC4E4|nr:hypothetical protein [Sphingomonas sp. SORGH_AS_0742]